MLFKADDKSLHFLKLFLYYFSIQNIGLRKNILALISVSKLSQVILKFIGELSKIFELPVCVLICFSCVQLFVNLWTVAHQDPLSMGFYRQA